MSNVKQDRPLVVVTGSSGLIGQRVVEQLAGDYRVAALDIEEPATTPATAQFFRCDLTDEASVPEVLRKIADQLGSQIASMVHLAAYYDFSGEPSPMYDELTVEGTRRLLQGLKSQNFQVQQFLFSSTLLVMKSADDDHPLTASSVTDAEWAYPQSKLQTEALIQAERGEIPAVILRLAGIYDEQGHSVPIAQQMSRIYEKQLESYLFPGDTSHGQSFVHLDDAVESIRAAIVARERLASHEVFLIGEEDVMSYQQLQEGLGELIHGEQWPTIRIPAPVAKAGAWVKEKFATSEKDAPFIKPWMIDLADQNYPINIHRARRALEWEPQQTLRETLPRMVACLKENPRRWYGVNGLPLPEELKTEELNAS